MIEFGCPACGKVLRADDGHVGKRAKCKECGAAVTVPEGRALAAVGSPARPSVGADVADRPDPPPTVNLPPRSVAAPVPVPGDGETALEPWYYLAIDIFALFVVGAGAIQFAVCLLAAINGGPAPRPGDFDAAREPSWVGGAGVLTSAAIFVGSIIAAAPMKLMVDLAKNVRQLRMAAER